MHRQQEDYAAKRAVQVGRKAKLGVDEGPTEAISRLVRAAPMLDSPCSSLAKANDHPAAAPAFVRAMRCVVCTS